MIQQKDYPQAITALKQLVQKSPDHLQAQQKLGYCLLRQEELEAAIHLFKDILQNLESDNFSLLYLGLALAKQGKTQEALATWKRYFNIDQPYIQRAINLQIALSETDDQGSNDDVVACLEEAIAAQEKADW
jgi:tetratricopeptide (TPR) repeat protein